MLWNIYNKKWELKEAIKYLEEANKISEWKDGFILFNLWVSYSNIDKAKAKIYLQKAKEILPDDKNLDNFLKIF
jgi:tetratricopeptide (TPR) repeat protein